MPHGRFLPGTMLGGRYRVVGLLGRAKITDLGLATLAGRPIFREPILPS